MRARPPDGRDDNAHEMGIHSIIHELRDEGDSPGRRGELLRRVTDLFIADAERYSDEQIALFDDVISELAGMVEQAARILLAKRLAPVRKAPPKIMHVLAADDAIEVAAPVLMESERLDDATLIENARTKSQQHLLAISHRRQLSEPVTDVLVERGDYPVLLSTAGNSGAIFSALGFANLVQRSVCEDRLALVVGTRRDIPPHLFLKLLATASDAVRAKLQAESPRASREIDEVVEEVTERIRAAARRPAIEYGRAQTLVRSLQSAGQLNAGKVESFAVAGKLAETTVAIAVMSDLSIEAIEDAMVEYRPETLLIVAKAIGFPWPVVKAVLGLRAGQNGLPAKDIEHGLAIFERLKRHTAQQILRFHQMRRSQPGTPAGTTRVPMGGAGSSQGTH
jgi:uncharacterized protein (DUF2336 family)